MTTLSIVVNFFNMRREAARTLHTLSRDYQRDLGTAQYEVIAVDNGSSQPLELSDVMCHGDNFRLIREPPGNPSPCAAINRAVASARGSHVMVCIDGARMLSPGVVSLTLQALALSPHAFVYTLGMHLGSKPQNESMAQGYNQPVEDALLASFDWQADGYRLFRVSSVAYSSFKGFFSLLTESNCYGMSRQHYLQLGGLDEGFAGAGGGLANLDLFNRVHESIQLQPIMLLGEATFHQFHGGVATNVAPSEHPWPRMEQEYRQLRGRPFASATYPPLYLGRLLPAYHAGLANFDAGAPPAPG